MLCDLSLLQSVSVLCQNMKVSIYYAYLNICVCRAYLHHFRVLFLSYDAPSSFDEF
jgi:hypothetical protein